MNLDVETQCISLINFCFVPQSGYQCKPNKNLYKNCLDSYFDKLLTLMVNKNFKPTPLLVSSLFILFKELTSKGPWNIDDCDLYAVKLNLQFMEVCNESLENIFLSKTFTGKQEVFDLCMTKLHQSLTPENYKYFPAQIEVYISMIDNIKVYNVSVNPQKVLHGSLVLIDDCLKENKLKGLHCCAEVLELCNEEAFKEGNYYEVIYRSLTRSIAERDIETTKQAMECFNKLVKTLPHSDQNSKYHDLLVNTLNELHTESNLYRKALLLQYVTKIVKSFGIESVKHKKKLTIILTDNLDMCLTEGVQEILLLNTLECLQEWIKHCWCVLKLSVDYKLLTVLLKLFLMCQNEIYLEPIQKSFSTLVLLYADEDQKKIGKDLTETMLKLKSLDNLKYHQRIEMLNNNLNIKI